MSEYREQLHNLIGEFRRFLCREEVEIPKDTDAVLVLSREVPEENKARTEFGVELLKRITALRLGLVRDAEVTGQPAGTAPRLILVGPQEQLSEMLEVIESRGIPEDRVVRVLNDPPQKANTKTQIEEVIKQVLPSGISHLTLVSSDYHGPRVARTADLNLPKDIDFTFVGMPCKGRYNVFEVVRSEAKKIFSYSQKGDVSLSPKRAQS